jgi:hypothetical protein
LLCNGRKEKGKEKIRLVQVAPLQPMAQVQMSGEVHVPPFWQGEEHTAAKKDLKNKIEFTTIYFLSSCV